MFDSCMTSATSISPAFELAVLALLVGAERASADGVALTLAAALMVAAPVVAALTVTGGAQR